MKGKAAKHRVFYAKTFYPLPKVVSDPCFLPSKRVSSPKQLKDEIEKKTLWIKRGV